jgi:hypothetical protein
LAHLTPDGSQVNARIVFWGIAGAGVSSNLRVIHDKLRSDHRGELQSIPTRLDPTTHYELLPIELGQVNGLRTQLQIVALPGGAEHAPTRKQLLDHVDGIVFIVDSRPEQVEANLESLNELRAALAAYGQTLDELPVVVQYNKRDASDPYVIEELHRKLDLPGAAVFEAVSNSGKGVLQTLTTISKRVVRVLREADLQPAAPEPEPADEVEAAASSDVELMESAILAEAEDDDAEVADTGLATLEALDQPWDGTSDELKSSQGARIGPDFEIVSVGVAKLTSERSVQLPLVLGNPEGETVTLCLTVALDPLLDGGE